MESDIQSAKAALIELHISTEDKTTDCKAAVFVRELLPEIKALRQTGWSFVEIADALSRFVKLDGYELAEQYFNVIHEMRLNDLHQTMQRHF